MSKKSKRSVLLWILVGFLALGVIGFVLFVAMIGALIAKQEVVVQEGVLELKLNDALAEGPTDNPLELFAARLGGDKNQHLWNIRRALQHAATDPRVHALRMDISAGVGGMAVAQEIQDLVSDFRERSHKPVYAYLNGDFASDQTYFLATAADTIWLSPEAGVMVHGIRFEVPFWRGTLEKLHIEPYFIMYKEYKSAAEPYSRYEMSDYFREHLTALGEDMEAQLVSTIAERRLLSPKAVEEAIDRGLMTATEALDAGWVDRLGYADELENTLAAAAGLDEYEGIPLGKYLKNLNWNRKKLEGDRVAVVFAEGPIVAGGKRSPFEEARIHGPKVAENLEEAAEDDQVRAIVLRVNSPGGSAVGSDFIWRAISKARGQGKPVIVSMSSVAGSGGYWISMGADKIVAQPTTITGSIGVVFGKFNLRGFYEWIGANISDVTLARNADLMSAFEPLKPAHEARFRAWMDEVYGHFKQKVAEGRGMDVEAVEAIAKGRIWSGVDAKENGLVDEVGGLSVALRLAREAAGLPDNTPAVAYPAPKDFFQMLAEHDFDVRVRTRLSLFDLWTPLHTMRTLPGDTQFAALLQELETPRPWVLMPPIELK